MASTKKCLAQSNKPCTGGKATKKRRSLPTARHAQMQAVPYIKPECVSQRFVISKFWPIRYPAIRPRPGRERIQFDQFETARIHNDHRQHCGPAHFVQPDDERKTCMRRRL